MDAEGKVQTFEPRVYDDVLVMKNNRVN
jgi:hypothetical protein